MLSRRACARRRAPWRQWLDELNAILPVERGEVFPGDQLLDHIPQLIVEIAHYLKAPESEAISANTAVMAKAAELGALRYSQRASVHQLLREPTCLVNCSNDSSPSRWRRWARTPMPSKSLSALRPRVAAERARAAAADGRHVCRQVFRDHRTTDRTAARIHLRLVSHEIRQPLGVLHRWRVCKSQRPGERPVDSDADRNRTSTRRHCRQTRTDFARVANPRRGHTHRAGGGFAALARDVTRQLEDMALARGVQVVVNDDLPRLSSPMPGGRSWCS